MREGEWNEGDMSNGSWKGGSCLSSRGRGRSCMINAGSGGIGASQQCPPQQCDQQLRTSCMLLCPPQLYDPQ